MEVVLEELEEQVEVMGKEKGVKNMAGKEMRGIEMKN
jgi:hypothetical protein